MVEKAETFLINITIIEGRHLAWMNMDSAVTVRVDNQRKCTGIRYNTDSPFFNEYFVFEFHAPLQIIIDKAITLTVIQPRKVLRSKKILGYITFDIATVWTQPDHQFYHKWAILSPPTSDSSGAPRGYLKVDVNIVRKGEAANIPTIASRDTDEIEGNLMLPHGITTERQRAKYVFKIYRGANLCKTKYLDMKYPPPPERDPPSPYVQVCFAGLQAKTSIKKNTTSPEWNQSLSLTELFPPLCQRIKVYLRSIESCQDVVLSVHHINLRSISNDREQGFLPTFGPAFVHFYAEGNTNKDYVGKVLMSFSTELQSNVGVAKSIHTEQIPALLEYNLWKTEAVMLFGIVFNANSIDKMYSDKPISFEISFGSSETQDNKSFSNRTNPQTPQAKGKSCWSLEYGQDKPCLFTILNLPDFRTRMFNFNMISKIGEELKSRLNAIEQVLLKEEFTPPSSKLESMLLDVTDFLSSACRKYIDISSTDSSDYGTPLDEERKKLSLREMEEIENRAKAIYDPRMKKNCYETMQKLLQQLETLAIEEQDCWPEIFLSMISGSKKVAYAKCSARDILYSVIKEQKGKHCGKLQSLFLKPKISTKSVNSISCKLDIFLWIGLERQRNKCFKAFPPGFVFPSDLEEDRLPSYLVAQEKYYFQCRAHIYQGKFSPGSDRSGLCDPYAKLAVGGECQQTEVSQATLNPVWDQSLIFSKLVLFGTKPYIAANPPLIVMEILDQDECFKSEFVGRCTLNPIIKFSEDPYTSPKFPPKLRWYDITKGADVVGEVLAVAELLELTDTSDHNISKPSKEIIRVPSDIKPHTVKYRIEVIFWGVRELKRANLLSITKPKIILECGYVALHSDPVINSKTNLNFTKPLKQMDVSLPEEEEYAPPICIKMFDCRSFGRYTLAGTHIVSASRFIYGLRTVEERNQNLLTTPTTSQGKSQRRRKRTSFGSSSKSVLTGFLSLEHQNYSSWMEYYMKKLPVFNKLFIIFKQETLKIKGPSPEAKRIKDKKRPKSDQTTKSSKRKKSCLRILCKMLYKIIKTLVKLPFKIFFCFCSVCLAPFRSGKKKKAKDSKKVRKNKQHKRVQKKPSLIEEIIQEEDDDELDWWSKYYSSVEIDPSKTAERNKKGSACTLKIYLNELEAQPEFESFTDVLQTFQMYKGKRTGDETVDEENILGIFKGAIKLYRWPQPNNSDYVTVNGLPLENGVFQDFASNEPLRFVVRIYCVKGISLRPKDVSGKSDPYICIAMGDQAINDRSGYVPQQINPIFGRCFELRGTFSQHHAITISVWDWDLASSDDLIGETKIDIENRFYTRHRAHCGIASQYKEQGYCWWREHDRPSRILEKLCKKSNLDTPHFSSVSVQIMNQEFRLAPSPRDKKQTILKKNKEELALLALHNWQQIPVVGCHLVPEHVETRPLYHPAKPGLEQGKLQLWVDIFPCTDLPPPPQVDITPRKPVAYELRVIIWNTDEVILDEDDFFVGERMSDIYVKGWVVGPEEAQCTDVHYRSMTGEGSFNWRFVFRFKYISTENKLIIRKKVSIFSVDETEQKLPCKLTLQVWDNDTFSADDFLGSVALDLSRLPRGARSAEMCTLRNLSHAAPTLNLFKIRRTKGWWPFRGIDKETKKEILAGKVEMELELLTQEEAEKTPAGIARTEPQPLPRPVRPDTSFSWFRNPLKALKFLICKHYRCRIIKCCICLLIIFAIAIGFYSFPGYTVKKLLKV